MALSPPPRLVFRLVPLTYQHLLPLLPNQEESGPGRLWCTRQPGLPHQDISLTPSSASEWPLCDI
ncbi:rCG46085 [Rattus norvegicus]|uniref:RCG46085 n=1 Tax=Rattus norvegicus TaxID=10116 RepID=A6ICA1_RAT|nr:rCG46085 [Rattus norvegicus]